MVKVGLAAKHVREVHSLSQKAAAEMLGVSAVHLCNIEKGKSLPSAHLLESYRQLWQVDLYVLAWCLFGDISALPAGIREASAALAQAWQAELLTSDKNPVTPSRPGCCASDN